MDSFIIQALTDNDYTDQDVEYFCIERSPEIIARYEQYATIAKEAAAKLEGTFCPLFNISFWDGFDTFSESFEEMLPKEGSKRMFLDVTEEVTDKYESPHARLGSHQVKVDAHGMLHWVAFGKYCGTKYWTGGTALEEFKQGAPTEEEAVPT